MIRGIVKSDEARIRLKVNGPEGRVREVEAVIDTGCTASLTLPPDIVAELGLRWRGMDSFTLADGSECAFDAYMAVVEWDGKMRPIIVNEADADSLIGMRLLRGHELKMQVRDRGTVTIKRLRAR